MDGEFCELYYERKIGIVEAIERGKAEAGSEAGGLCILVGYLQAKLAMAEQRIRSGRPYEYSLPEERS